MKRALMCGIAAVLIAAVTLLHADDAKDLQNALDSRYKGKILFLRKPSSGSKLGFSADGRPLRTESEADSNEPLLQYWTLDGIVQVKKLSLTAAGLELEGRRVVAVYDRDKKDFQFTGGPSAVKVQMQLGPGVPSLQSVELAMSRVFISDEAERPHDPPQYSPWRQVKPAESSPQKPQSKVPPACDPQKELCKVQKGTTPPRPVYTPDPWYTESARNARLMGVVTLWAIIDDRGRIADLRIVKPLGKGLDEAAIDTVRRWRFEPSRYQGKPVRVQMNIEVSFRM